MEQVTCRGRYLHTVFLRDIGLPPKERMRRERMVVARRKLIAGKRAEEISAELGFSCQNNFRREFLTIYRVPPVQFQMERWGLGDEWRRAASNPEEVIVRMQVPIHGHGVPGGGGERREERNECPRSSWSLEVLTRAILLKRWTRSGSVGHGSIT